MVVDRRSAFAFGTTMLASAMINNIFVSYYMDYFMNVERISPSAFYIGGILAKQTFTLRSTQHTNILMQGKSSLCFGTPSTILSLDGFRILGVQLQRMARYGAGSPPFPD